MDSRDDGSGSDGFSDAPVSSDSYLEDAAQLVHAQELHGLREARHPRVVDEAHLGIQDLVHVGGFVVETNT